MQKSIKIQVGRAQLSTALELFVRDKDPISVHCLACGGGEVIEGVAEHEGIEPFSTAMVEQHPTLDKQKLRKIRNQYWNAFKHLTTRSGLMRDDEELLANFDDTQNDMVLFVGWWDYLAITNALPVAVQVFQMWWYAVYEEKLTPGTDLGKIRATFPSIKGMDRAEQKRRLRRAVEKWRKNSVLLSDPRTERSLHTP